MLFGRQIRFPTFTYFFPFAHVQVLHQAFNYSSEGSALRWFSGTSVFASLLFFVYNVQSVQSLFKKTIITFFTAIAVQSDDPENNGIMFSLFSTPPIFLFSKLYQTVDSSYTFLYR